MFTAMRTTVGADRAREHFEAHAKKETISALHMRCEEAVDWATRGGSRALKLDSKIGSLEVGKKADVVLIKNDASPVMFPILNPYGHVVMQAQRGDVHTVVIDGRIVKQNHQLVDSKLEKAKKAVRETVDYLREQMGEETWEAGMHPEIPDTKLNENPYTYTTFDSGSADWKKK